MSTKNTGANEHPGQKLKKLLILTECILTAQSKTCYEDQPFSESHKSSSTRICWQDRQAETDSHTCAFTELSRHSRHKIAQVQHNSATHYCSSLTIHFCSLLHRRCSLNKFMPNNKHIQQAKRKTFTFQSQKKMYRSTTLQNLIDCCPFWGQKPTVKACSWNVLSCTAARATNVINLIMPRLQQYGQTRAFMKILPATTVTIWQMLINWRQLIQTELSRRQISHRMPPAACMFARTHLHTDTPKT